MKLLEVYVQEKPSDKWWTSMWIDAERIIAMTEATAYDNGTSVIVIMDSGQQFLLRWSRRQLTETLRGIGLLK